MGGYLEYFQLHNDTSAPIEKHVKQLLVEHQEELDIQVTSASIHRKTPSKLYTHQHPEVNISNSGGHYRIELTEQAHHLLNKHHAVTHRILSQITNEHHNHYELPLISDKLIKRSQTTIIDSYKRTLDTAMHQNLFGKLSNQIYTREVTLPRVATRRRLINVLEATNNKQLDEVLNEQYQDYIATIVSNMHEYLRKDGLATLARHTATELLSIHKNTQRPIEKFTKLIDYQSTQDAIIDLQDTHNKTKPLFRRQENQEVLITSYTDTFLELVHKA